TYIKYQTVSELFFSFGRTGVKNRIHRDRFDLRSGSFREFPGTSSRFLRLGFGVVRSPAEGISNSSRSGPEAQSKKPRSSLEDVSKRSRTLPEAGSREWLRCAALRVLLLDHAFK
ncbi:hypothetical protein, partial [Parapedobacter lycopersici]|uniref:hypothetical protein n=1 Tax=Parapedobacter lycopersici TaxID=1864939 RepID=UPI0033425CA4